LSGKIPLAALSGFHVKKILRKDENAVSIYSCAFFREDETVPVFYWGIEFRVSWIRW